MSESESDNEALRQKKKKKNPAENKQIKCSRNQDTHTLYHGTIGVATNTDLFLLLHARTHTHKHTHSKSHSRGRCALRCEIYFTAWHALWITLTVAMETPSLDIISD